MPKHWLFDFQTECESHQSEGRFWPAFVLLSDICRWTYELHFKDIAHLTKRFEEERKSIYGISVAHSFPRWWQLGDQPSVLKNTWLIRVLIIWRHFWRREKINMEPQMQTLPPVGNTCLICQLPLSYNWSPRSQCSNVFRIANMLHICRQFHWPVMIGLLCQCSMFIGLVVFMTLQINASLSPHHRSIRPPGCVLLGGREVKGFWC